MKKFFIGSITVISTFLGVISIIMGIWWYSHIGRYPLEKQKADLTNSFVEDFIQVTIPTVLWEDYRPVEILTQDWKFLPSLSKYIDQYGIASIYRDHDYTKYSVLTTDKFRKTGHLNKFTAKTVHVVLHKTFESLPAHPAFPDYEAEAAEAAIRSFLDQLSDISGINFTFQTNMGQVKPEKPETGPSLFPAGKNYILIDVFTGTPPNNSFKKANLVRGSYDVDGIEKYRKNVIPFTPYLRAQVDGYFAINQNNEIERSYCRLNFNAVHFSRSMSSLKECLLRSLGLPNESYSRNALLLSNFNAEYEPYVSTRFMDGFGYLFIREHTSPAETPFQVYESFQKLYKNGQGITPEAVPGVPLSDYDEKMLRTLYSPGINPGMTKKDINDTLKEKE